MTTLQTLRYLICNNEIEEAFHVIEDLDEKDRVTGQIVKSFLMIEQGKLFEIDQFIQECESQSLTIDEQFAYLTLKINFLWRKGALDDFLDIVREGTVLIDKVNANGISPCFIGHFYKIIGNYFWDKGEPDQAQKYYTLSLEVWEKIDYKIEIAKIANNEGIIHFAKGEYDQALEKYKKNISMKLKLCNTADISPSLSNIGEVYLDMGELDNAIGYFEKSIHSIQKINSTNTLALAYRYVNLGIAYIMKGLLDRALSYLYDAKSIYEHFENLLQLSRTLGYIGNAWYHKNDQVKAENYLLDAIRLGSKFDNDLEMSILYYNVVLVSLERKHDPILYLKKFDKLCRRSNIAIVKLRCQLAKAAYYQSLPKFSSKAIAMEFYQEIIDNNLMTEMLKNEARIGICELLLSEFEILGNDDEILLITNIIDEIYHYGQKEKAYPYIIRALEFKARLLLLQNNFAKAQNALEIAEFFAQERKLNLEVSRLHTLLEQIIINEKSTYPNHDDDQDYEDEAIISDYLEYLKKFGFNEN